MHPNMYLNVSIHDVSPVHQEEIETLFALVEGLGVRRGTLLVVPDFHGKSPLRRQDPLVSWLFGLVPSWEIALHGFTHQDDLQSVRQGDFRERPKSHVGLLQYFVSHFYTQMEGEFYLLPYEEALWRMKLGTCVLRDCGLEPQGFVAPAWLLSQGAFLAVRQCGFRYTTTLKNVYGFSGPEGGKGSLGPYIKYSAPAITFSSRSLLRACLSKAIVPYLAKRALGCHLVRVALHPKDAHYPFILDLASNLIKMLLEKREPLTIGEYVEGKGKGLATREQ